MNQQSLHKNLEKLGLIIGDKHRLKIIQLLNQKDWNATELSRQAIIRQNLLSHHLNILKQKKIIQARVSGRFIYYSLNRQELKNLYKDLKTLIN